MIFLDPDKWAQKKLEKSGVFWVYFHWLFVKWATEALLCFCLVDAFEALLENSVSKWYTFGSC